MVTSLPKNHLVWHLLGPVQPPGRERAFGHLRRDVPLLGHAGGGHHPAGRRGRQLLHHRPGGGRDLRRRREGVHQLIAIFV